jgi:outer membrane protein
MKRFIVSTIVCGALGLAPAATLRAQGITDEHIQELIRTAAERAGVSSALGAAPAGQSRQSSADGTPALPLTLDAAIKLALDRNLDIAVQRLNPQTFDFSIAGLQSIYRPVLTSALSAQSATNPSQQTTQGQSAGTGINQGVTTYNGGLTQASRWGGGSLAVAINNNRTTTSSLTALFDPAYNTNWSATYTQPLLKNFKIDTTRQQLVITNLNQDISEIQLQQTIINTISNVRNAYWDFVYATQAVEVAQQSLDLATKLVQDNQTRVEVGTMAPIDVVQAKAEEATRRQGLVSAENTRRTTELALKRLVVSGTEDPNWQATLEPVDRPDFQPLPVDLPTAVRRALDSRTDLAVVKKNLEVNDVTLKFLKNQALPQADVSLRYGALGQGGTSFITSGSGINRVVTGTIPGGYSDALSTLFKRNYPSWNLSLNVNYPLGTSAQDASLARAKVQLSQIDAQMKQIELQVATDVTSAAINLRNAAESVQASQAARDLSTQRLEAEQSKFEVGMSTNYQVVQAQRDLSDARNSELRAILNYRKAQVEFERLQQTTLGASNITILGR